MALVKKAERQKFSAKRKAERPWWDDMMSRWWLRAVVYFGIIGVWPYPENIRFESIAGHVIAAITALCELEVAAALWPRVFARKGQYQRGYRHDG
jgi:hypothetical protein